MRNLLDTIFDNLIAIIIVVSVVIRIFVGIKNSTASRRRSAAVVPQVGADDEGDVWSRLKPDNDDDEERGRPEPYHAPAAAIAQPFEPVITTRPLEAVVEKPNAERPDRGPLDRLNRLPPLRRAVVLAEILGPPRGLSNFPASGHN